MTNLDPFESHRRDLIRLAYRMLGTLSDAEDVVQEAFLRWKRAGSPVLEDPRSWFARTCTRLCLDHLKSAQRQRESYVGEWLPEPWVEPAVGGDASERYELDETLSMALLTTIQRLRPAERATFLLHDVFGYAFSEVAAILGRTPAGCRQLAVRARRRLSEGPSHLAAEGSAAEAADATTIRQLSEAFFDAIRSGDLEGLRALLADDVVLHSDGGGKALATRAPIEGAAAVARFFHRIFRSPSAPSDPDLRPLWFNGAPGVVLWEAGQPSSAFQFLARDGCIAAIHVQRNPEKLTEVAKLRAGDAPA